MARPRVLRVGSPNPVVRRPSFRLVVPSPVRGRVRSRRRSTSHPSFTTARGSMPAPPRRIRRRLPEFALIRRIASRLPRRPSDVIAGIGDDAAIVRLTAATDLLLTTDLLAERIHFDPKTESWTDIGFK